MHTIAQALLMIPTGIVKPVTISFDEVGTPTTIPTPIGAFYAAEKLVSFGAGVYFADYPYTDGVINTGIPSLPGARSGAKYAHFIQDNGSFIMSFAPGLRARKIEFYWQKGSGWEGMFHIAGSGGQHTVVASVGSSVTSWTKITIDLDTGPFDPAYWLGDFITEIKINVASFGVMAIEDITVF